MRITISYGMYIEEKKDNITKMIQYSRNVTKKINKCTIHPEAYKYKKHLKLGDGEVNHKKMKRQQAEEKDNSWEQQKMHIQFIMLMKEDFMTKRN